MLIPLNPSKGDWRLACMSCDEQRIIEGARSKEGAQREAIFLGWTRAASNDHECPECSQTSIERLVKQTY